MIFFLFAAHIIFAALGFDNNHLNLHFQVAVGSCIFAAFIKVIPKVVVSASSVILGGRTM